MNTNKIVDSIQNKNIRFKKTTINLGFQLLRFLLCFWIVVCHCSRIRKEHRKYLNRAYHVPTFIVLSFYFYYPVISKKNTDKVISRFQRLLIPYIFWPSFISILRLTKPNVEVSLKNYCLQLLIGSSIHNIFWFQFNLIFISLIFSIICFAFNKDRIKILIFIGLFGYNFHLSNFNFLIVSNYKSYLRSNIGSLIELTPLAVNGSIFNSINLLMIVDKCSIVLKNFLFWILFILFKYDIFLKQPGYRYSNISLYIISSLILFLSFGTLPFKKLKEKN